MISTHSLRKHRLVSPNAPTINTNYEVERWRVTVDNKLDKQDNKLDKLLDLSNNALSGQNNLEWRVTNLENAPQKAQSFLGLSINGCALLIAAVVGCGSLLGALISVTSLVVSISK